MERISQTHLKLHVEVQSQHQPECSKLKRQNGVVMSFSIEIETKSVELLVVGAEYRM